MKPNLFAVLPSQTSNFIDLIQFHLICKILAKLSGVEFERTESELRKIKTRKFLCCVHQLHEGGA